MLLIHMTGSVRIGEVVRYTLTYTPAADRILPAPSHLHVKIRNTSAIPLRAAYLHGPYTLYAACYPSTFDPNKKHVRYQEEGAPEFEPNLKAGGHWTSKLTVPEEIRDVAGTTQSRQSLDGDLKSFTWIIEIASQVLFSTTAAVHFELLVGRDERSVELGFHGVVGSGHGAPGKLEDHQQGRSRNAAQPKGVFSKAVRLAVDDTESLWNSPPFPEWDKDGDVKIQDGPIHGDKIDAQAKDDHKTRKQKKVHLVVLCHGIHSNLGADMLYLKESIDTAARQAREDSKKRRAEMRKKDAEEKNRFARDAVGKRTNSAPESVIAAAEGHPMDNDEDEEQVLVRGFNGNAVRTEKGIQYLGKRLAKYVLSVTYPDQPYLPVKSSISKSITRSLTGQKSPQVAGQPTHKHSSIIKDEQHLNHNLAYKITSISFISHSLGGLVQTYAIAYIQKHSPDFFELIKPINFVALATPFLGLSNENPMYVKFALDFGLVGRTGQDLGLSWRTPTIVRSGWGAMIGGLGNEQAKHRQPDPSTKPLLRILPTGPAHIALKKFRNRSVYSNVVNDGIVPLRTSCLLFLDWRGLGRVEKARRENGLVGTMVGWGWAEMTGQNASSPRKGLFNDFFNDSGDDASSSGQKAPREHDHGDDVPQAEAGEGLDNDTRQTPEKRQFLTGGSVQDETYHQERLKESSVEPPSMWGGLVSLFKPQNSPKAHHYPPKHQKPYLRGQIMKGSISSDGTASNDGLSSAQGEDRRGPVRGSSLYTNNSRNDDLQAPPKTTFFESAGDVLNPPLPPKDFLIDPEARPRTIFHDRVYHPEDIPAPPPKRQRTLMARRLNSRDGADMLRKDSVESASSNVSDEGGMKIEEKIARAYHKDLSWRKVLVRLEPDAHNNMVVRRMFANAYGWPVIKHICDTHFAYTAAATMADADETGDERAKPSHVRAGKEGEEVTGLVDQPQDVEQDDGRPKSAGDGAAESNAEKLKEDVQKLNIDFPAVSRTDSERRESRDEVSELVSPVTAKGEGSYSSLNSARPSLAKLVRSDSARWSDRFFEGSDDSSDDEEYQHELQKARARGEKLSKREEERAAKAESPLIAGKLTASPKESTLDLLTGDPAEQASDSARAVLVSKTSPLSLTDVGLRKNFEEQISPSAAKRGGSLGVVEQVALASSKKDES